MQRADIGVRRIVLPRRPVLLPCGVCHASIPFKPSVNCPECGERPGRPRAPLPPDGALILNEDVAIIDETTEEVVAVQVMSALGLANRAARDFRRIKHWNDSRVRLGPGTGQARLSGITSSNITFGFSAPSPLRRRYGCARCRFDTQETTVAEHLQEFARTAERTFRTLAPDVYARTTTTVREEIAGAWLLAGTPWTSGIINNTAALPYHKDSGNISGSWSAMMCIKRNVKGGLLHLVDYDAWLTIPHGSISIFDGQSVTHGVSPLRFTGPNPFRYTIVSYAKSGMKRCAPTYAEEVQRARRASTAAEDKRASR